MHVFPLSHFKACSKVKVTFYISLRGPVSNQKHCKLNWKVSFTQIHLGWRTFIHVYSSNACCVHIGTRCCSWLGHYSTSRKVVDSFPD